MEGLWTAEFGSSEGIYGGGVVIFKDGRVLGGDAGYYYVGSYERTGGDSFIATVQVKPFMEGVPSVFNTLRKDFTLNLSGRFKDADHAIAQGHPTEMPEMDLGIVLTRREEVVPA